MANHATTGAPGRGRHWRRRAGLVLAAGAVLAGTGYALGPLGATASSHREAPLIASFPAYDTTDVYAFVSPERPGYVTLMANWIPFAEPNGGPNFYPFATDARYIINVDNNGDAKPTAWRSTLSWTSRRSRRCRSGAPSTPRVTVRSQRPNAGTMPRAPAWRSAARSTPGPATTVWSGRSSPRPSTTPRGREGWWCRG